jgi:uncharacterized protein (DUF2164 family)
MRVRLTDDRRQRVLRSMKRFFSETLDQELSDFSAERILDYFVQQLGPPVYNQAIQDARAFVQEKLEDLEGEFYEPESPAGGAR